MRRADMARIAVEQRQNLAERHSLAGLAGEGHHGNLILGGDLVLFAAGLDHCEHRFFSVFSPALRLARPASLQLLASRTADRAAHTRKSAAEPAALSGDALGWAKPAVNRSIAPACRDPWRE